MPKSYDPNRHDCLDHLLSRLLQALHAKIDHAKVVERAKKIVDDCAAQGWLVRKGWEDAWGLYKDKAGGNALCCSWFHDVPPPNTTDKPPTGVTDKDRGDALFDAFKSMVRLVMNSSTAYTAKKHRYELRDRLSVYLSLRGHDIDAIIQTASELGPVEPTRKRCLIRPNKIRWKGKLEVEQRLWHMLGYILDHRRRHGDNPIACLDIEEAIKGRRHPRTRNESHKYVANAASNLSKILLDLQFPWTVHTKSDLLVFAPTAFSQSPGRT
jgi:hypothetical protein